MDLADYLRENLHLYCVSVGLFVAAAVCPKLVPKPVVRPVQNPFILIAFPIVGISAAFDALVDVTSGKVNIHVLMALAAFASVFMGNPVEGGLLIPMFSLAHIAEEYFTSRSMVDVKELKESYPESALVLDVDSDGPTSMSDLKYTKVPLTDVMTEVSQGRSTVTIEHLTGEVKQMERSVGDNIPGGARNLDGNEIMEGVNTILLTEEAHQNKPRLQRWLDEFGDRYRIVVVAVAVALIGPLLFRWPLISTSACRGSIYRALGLMVAASPCALAVAPLAYATAISSCARKGILLKGGHVLDALASCHTIAFDKTGTLTTRGLKFKAIEPIHGHRRVTLFHFEDTPRPGGLDVISLLQSHRFRVMMLTGDHKSSAWRVANTVGISEVHRDLKTEDKLNHVARGGLIMVGDVNDAPVLAAATVGIVLARRASATAVADVLLLQDNISGVPFCIAKARQTTSLVKQNVALALTCMILASLPSVLGFLPLWLTNGGRGHFSSSTSRKR
ncbi:putative cadmium/zinc-transporting ATPase HMA1, chloroplastic [Drosera capensis]